MSFVLRRLIIAATILHFGQVRVSKAREWTRLWAHTKIIWHPASIWLDGAVQCLLLFGVRAQFVHNSSTSYAESSYIAIVCEAKQKAVSAWQYLTQTYMLMNAARHSSWWNATTQCRFATNKASYEISRVRSIAQRWIDREVDEENRILLCLCIPRRWTVVICLEHRQLRPLHLILLSTHQLCYNKRCSS